MRRSLRAVSKKDRGSALVAAVAGLLAFSYIGFEVLAADRGVIASVRGSTDRARLAAAADAGIAMALDNLMGDPASRWPIDGSVQQLDFGSMRIAIAVEDERGKVPLNQLTEDQVRNLFAAAGVSGVRLDALTDAFEDWFDNDEDVRPLGAEDAYYTPLGMRPRNGELRSVEELAAIKGMDAALVRASRRSRPSGSAKAAGSARRRRSRSRSRSSPDRPAAWRQLNARGNRPASKRRWIRTKRRPLSGAPSRSG